MSLTLMKVSVKKASNQQEKSIAKEVGARQVPASGAVKFGGYDLYTETHCIEVKYTNDIHFVLKHTELEKIRKIALSKNKIPAFVFEFKDIGTRYVVHGDVVDTESTLTITTKTFKLSDNTLQNVLKDKDVTLFWSKQPLGAKWLITTWQRWSAANGTNNKSG